MNKRLLFLDDIRNPFDKESNWLVFSPIPLYDLKEVIWVKSYVQFTDWIKSNGLPDGICFDHDLSIEHYGLESKSDFIWQEYYRTVDREMTGYDCAKWLVDFCIDNNLKLPLWNVQSMNPVGKENINSLLNNYLKRCQT